MFGQTIKYLRTEKKWSLRLTAKKLEISHVHLCNIENDLTGMSLQLLDRINVVFDTNLLVMQLILFDNTLPEKLKNDLTNWLKNNEQKQRSG